MRRDLGAAVPRDPRAPWAAIAWFGFVMIGGLLSACSILALLLVMLEAGL